MQKTSKNLTIFTSGVLLSISLLFAVSCSRSNVADSNIENRSANANATNSNATKDEIAELTLLIRLPETPDEAVWREEENVNPPGKKMTAVLKYNSERAGKIVAAAENKKPPTQTEIGTEDWFPEELTAQTQLSGNKSLKGIVYDASDFYNAPYKRGRLVRVQETDYFVLELTSY